MKNSIYNVLSWQIVEDGNTSNEACNREFDHTWNLDGQNGNNNEDDDHSDLSVESLAANQGERKTVINEEDVAKFIEIEKESTEQASSGVSTKLKLEIGMEFKTTEEAQQYFNMYSFAAGFSIVVVSVYHTTSKKEEAMK